MKITTLLISIICLIYFFPLSGISQETYPIPEDAQTQAGVPQGDIKGPFTIKSNIFPGTEREYWLYIPAQYKSTDSACVMIVNDGLGLAEQWHLPTVYDNLIHKKEVPVTIGIFVQWGLVPSIKADTYGRYNRSFEYDALGNRYARFLIEELLPEVSKTYSLKNDADSRLISGHSSGAIAAFNAAWERPDAFRRVFSAIGTYVSLRGGHEFPMLVRKMEKKPIRIFLQDGSNDLDIYAGSWWVANQDMLASLQWAGYEVNHLWGEGGHNSKHASSLMPDALRWLWKDYPTPVTNPQGVERRMDLLLPDEAWQQVRENNQHVGAITTGRGGEVFFIDPTDHKIYEIDAEGKQQVYLEGVDSISALAYGNDDRLYLALKNQQKVVAYDREKNRKEIMTGAICDYLLITQQGIYFTNTSRGEVSFFQFDTRETTTYHEVTHPTGLALSAEQTFLNVGDKQGPLGYSYQIDETGALRYGQTYTHYHIPYGQAGVGVQSLVADTEDRLYAATYLGIQVTDQLGRVHFIVANPQDGNVQQITWGGKNLDTLYAVCGGKLFKRRIKATGMYPWLPPVKPPQPKL